MIIEGRSGIVENVWVNASMICFLSYYGLERLIWRFTMILIFVGTQVNVMSNTYMDFSVVGS